MNVTNSAKEGEEARQRAFLFSSTTDFAFSFSGGGFGNNLSKLWGIWSGKGVVRD